MEKSRKYYEELASKMLSGTITDIEQQALNVWMDARMEKSEYHFDPQYARSEEEVKVRILRRLLQRMDDSDQRERPSIQLFHKRYGVFPYVAALLALLLCIGFYIYNARQQDEIIAPGSNRATLTLADGRKVPLSEGQEGIILDDQFVYADGSSVMSDGQTLSLSPFEITTPRGGQYQVTLPDGTKVWLNAASRLRYPARFDDNQRIVELIGEAYFEVQSRRNKSGIQIPFQVKTALQTVEVLGTEFNITAYQDEPDIRTTLVEGSVKVTYEHDQLSHILKPGQQIITSLKGSTVRDVDIVYYTAWKAGKFVFDREPIQSVMQKLARWYAVDIVYSGELSSHRFSGTVSRFEDIGQVLQKLALTEQVRFTIEGRKIIVRK